MKFLGLLLLAVSAVAQVPTPQISLTGTAGSGGNFPFINSGSFAISDADYTVLWPNTTCVVCNVTSSVSLTATRSLIEPALAMTFNMTNSTTGGQSIIVKAPTGSGVTIPNGASKWVWFNGTNYVEIDPPGVAYPGAGVPNSTGSGWGTSYQVGTSANNLVQLNGSSALPAVSGANLTNLNGTNLQGGSVANSALGSPTITINSTPCTLGGSCSVTASTSRVLFVVPPQITAAGTIFVAYSGMSAPVETTLNGQFMPASGVAANLYAGLSSDPGSGITVQITLRVNGSVTGVGCTITGNGSTNKSCNDTIHTATIAQGAQADFQVTTSAGLSGTPFLSIATTY